jgi:hypothetical protein
MAVKKTQVRQGYFGPAGRRYSVYTGFNAPVTEVDRGNRCAPHNLSGKLFFCDICRAGSAGCI